MKTFYGRQLKANYIKAMFADYEHCVNTFWTRKCKTNAMSIGRDVVGWCKKMSPGCSSLLEYGHTLKQWIRWHIATVVFVMYAGCQIQVQTRITMPYRQLVMQILSGFATLSLVNQNANMQRHKSPLMTIIIRSEMSSRSATGNWPRMDITNINPPFQSLIICHMCS